MGNPIVWGVYILSVIVIAAAGRKYRRNMGLAPDAKLPLKEEWPERAWSFVLLIDLIWIGVKNMFEVFWGGIPSLLTACIFSAWVYFLQKKT